RPAGGHRKRHRLSLQRRVQLRFRADDLRAWRPLGPISARSAPSKLGVASTVVPPMRLGAGLLAKRRMLTLAIRTSVRMSAKTRVNRKLDSSSAPAHELTFVMVPVLSQKVDGFRGGLLR